MGSRDVPSFDRTCGRRNLEANSGTLCPEEQGRVSRQTPLTCLLLALCPSPLHCLRDAPPGGCAQVARLAFPGRATRL